MGLDDVDLIMFYQPIFAFDLVADVGKSSRAIKGSNRNTYGCVGLVLDNHEALTAGPGFGR